MSHNFEVASEREMEFMKMNLVLVLAKLQKEELNYSLNGYF